MDLIKLTTLLLFISIREVITQSSRNTCSSCVQIPGNAWCSHPNVSQARCQPTAEISCPKDFIVNLESSRISIQNSPKPKRMVQPSVVNVAIRPGEPVRFEMEFTQLKSHPVDIYMLLDASRSLILEYLDLSSGDFSRKLVTAMSNITNNLQLGLGTFVEKPEVPFGLNAHPEFNNGSCKDGHCEPPHTFRHFVPFGPKSKREFDKMLDKLHLSINEDKPESGFDGIVQAIVCRNIIKWRDESRKILVYVSDDKFHIAGDGKALGILTPNDGCCHLNTAGFYNESTRQDYPSVSQVASIVKQNSVNLMFAIEEKHREMYENLAKLIDGTKVGLRKNGDIPHMITEMYRNITSSITMQHINVDDDLRITYRSRCLNKTGQLNQTNTCDNLKINDTVKFEIELELLSCPKNKTNLNRTFHIQPIGVDEKLIVNVITNCDCNCKNMRFERNSSKCSYHGNFDCGVCECDSAYSGGKCSCAAGQDVDTKCFKDKKSPACSNRGRCDCNRCICDTNPQTGAPLFYGEFCECSNSSCPRRGGNLCSNNGECECNECKCKPGWTKDDCSCDTGTDKCKNTESGKVCSDHGHCECNKCVCDSTKNYSGNHCEKCPRSSTNCDELINCVSCLLDTSNKDNCTNFCLYNSQIVPDFGDNPPNPNDYNVCQKSDSNDCLMTYYYSTCKETNVKISDLKKCSTKERVEVTGIVITIVTAIIVVGLTFLLVWKAFIVVQDRREYKRFEKEKAQAKWTKTVNPIYVTPSTNHTNPLYESLAFNKET